MQTYVAWSRASSSDGLIEACLIIVTLTERTLIKNNSYHIRRDAGLFLIHTDTLYVVEGMIQIERNG